MKFLLILILCIIVNANGKTSTEIVVRILDEVKNLKNDLKNIQQDIEYLVVKKLLENPNVHKIQLALEKALQNRSITVECSVSINKRFDALANKVKLELIPEALKQVTDDANYFEVTLKNLQEIQNVLEIVKRSNVESRHNEELIRRYLDETDSIFLFIDSQQYILFDSINASVYFKSKDLLEKIKNDLVDPSSDCIKI